MNFKYEIYMPAGHEDWIDHDTPLAATDNYDHMMHYVYVFHYTRTLEYSSMIFGAVEGPIEVRQKEEVENVRR